MLKIIENNNKTYTVGMDMGGGSVDCGTFDSLIEAEIEIEQAIEDLNGSGEYPFKTFTRKCFSIYENEAELEAA